jgi:hypothetical integral membrane protein (TIGR02206 family)
MLADNSTLMDIFAGTDYTGAPFNFGDGSHLAALAVIIAINLGIAFRGQRLSAQQRVVFRYGLAALLLANEALWHWWNWRHGWWAVNYMLPLHLCNILVFISAWVLITKNYRGYEFLYFLGLAGATQVLITPDPGMFGFPHSRWFMVFIAHGGIATAAIYMTVVEGYRPYVRSMIRVATVILVYMVIIGAVNAWLGSNYLFIARKPDMPTLLDYLGSWPWYILSILAIGLALMLLLYLPFHLRDRKQPTDVHDNLSMNSQPN